MKNTLLFIFTFFALLIGHGQDQIISFPSEFNGSYFEAESSFTMVNELTGELCVFLAANNEIFANYFNEELDYKARIYHNALPFKYRLPLGGTIKEKKYTLFLSNRLKNKFAGISFDFDTNNYSSFELDLKFKKERFLASFSHLNAFYVLSVTQKENALYLYKFEVDGTFLKTTIDLSAYKFYGREDYPLGLSAALVLDSRNPLTEVLWVKDDLPYSLDSMTSILKLYLKEGTFYLVSDVNPDFSQIITYDVKTQNTDLIKIAFEELGSRGFGNSFLKDQMLFQIRVNSKKLDYQISDIKTQKTVRSFQLEKKDNLFLTDGVIKQRGGRYSNYREFEKTSQFIRKLYNGNPCIYVEKIENDYSVKIGSVDEIDNSLVGTVAFFNPFTIAAGVGSLTLFFNPAALALYKSSNTKAVYINSSLSKDFDIIPEIENENIFYYIQDYLNEEEIKRFIAADVFSYQNYFVFGRLDKKTQNYILLKFEKPD